MSLKRNRLLPLVLTILPLLLVGVGGLWGTRYMLQGIASNINEQEYEHTAQTVQSAFRALERQFAGLMVDNAPWDDAVANTYGTPNPQWLYDTWGISTQDANYDTSFILASDGSVIAAFQAGASFSTAPEDYFGPGYEELFSKMPASNVERLMLSSLIALEEPGRYALIGIGRILPTLEGTPAPAPQPNVLVFSKELTPALLTAMSQQYAVEHITLQPAAADTPPQQILRSALGTTVASANWINRDPGLTVRNANNRAATAIVLMLVGLLVPVSLAYFRITSMLQVSEKEARRAARHDPLSGLPNRILLLETLEKHVKNPPVQAPVLLFIDLDGFKAVNDVHDHAVGDVLIRTFAQGLRRLASPQDLVARLGGDEFAILLETGGATRATTLARQIVEYAQRPFLVQGKELLIGASIGIALWSDDISDPSEFMRRADLAMYSAKDSGRNTWCYFSHRIDENRRDDLLVASALRKFLETGQLRFAYQPIVDAHTHRITGVEALARWPDQSAIQPDRLIRVAEEHGLIEELFRYLAVRAMDDLKPYSDIQLSLNVSALQITNHRLINDIVDAARKTGFPPQRLELEFTESHLIRNADAARRLIRQLQELGMRIGLDDFGTGFASLGYLRDFAFNTVKLDRSLVLDALDNPSTRKIVQGTITIASSLSSDVVAEGIETPEQAVFMRDAGCRSLQGYYFHKPQSIADLRTILAAAEPATGTRAG